VTRGQGNLAAPGAIVLISCYELGHQPLGLAMPAAFLEAAGYEPRLLDLPIEGLPEDAIAKARFVGISVPMHTALRLGARVARRVRDLNPGARLCFFGLYASLNAEHLLAGLADHVVAGESEAALLGLIRALDAGRDPEGIGAAAPGREPAPSLAGTPFPVPSRRGLPPLGAYARLRTPQGDIRVGYVEATRGCKHLCRHCPIPPVYGGRFLVVPRETVLADIRNLVGAGAGHITFGDPDFLNAPTHALRVVGLMRAEFPAVTFDFTAKIEHLLRHRRLLGEFARLGGVFVVSAVESLSDSVLVHLDKGHTRADVERAAALVRAAGLFFRPTWVAFTPWTTLADYLEMLDFVERRDLVDAVDPVQYTVRLLVPPGSALLSRPEIRPYLRGLSREMFSYHWEHPDPRMDALAGDARRAVEAAVAGDQDCRTTFAAIRELAAAAAEGRAPRPVAPAADAGRERPPHLTEPWFCCAEPTEDQFGPVDRQLEV
jgi:radical SAM superfamily enzyme YgiQ (UPF0313 family)